jgi:hypothetical protein
MSFVHESKQKRTPWPINCLFFDIKNCGCGIFFDKWQIGKKNLPAICNVAFLEKLFPAEFLATHQ